MLQPLRHHLQQLHAAVDEASGHLNPAAILNDITVFCTLNLTEPEDYAQASAILFHAELGLLAFQQKVLAGGAKGAEKEHVAAQKATFDFVAGYLKLCGPQLGLPTLLVIKDWCVATFRRSASNMVQAAALPPLVRLLALCPDVPGLDAAALQAADLFALMFKAAGKKAGVSQSVRAGLYELLGLLMEQFPGQLSSQKDALQRLYFTALQDQRRRKDPEVTVLGGLLRGMAAFMDHFGGSLEEGTEWLGPLYQVVVSSLAADTGVTRHEVPKAALRLLGRHAMQLKEYLTVDCEAMLQRIRTFCLHRNPKVRKAAFPAGEAFLASVAFELVQGRRNADDNRRTYRNLLLELRKLLDCSLENRYEVYLGIMACGNLAAPIAVYSGQADLLSVFQRLLGLSTRMYALVQEDAEDSVKYLPSFLASFAHFINECSTVPVTVLRSLESVIRTLLLLYPKQCMFPKVQHGCCEGLVKLLVALHLNHDALASILPDVIYYGVTLTVASTKAFAGGKGGEDAEGALYEEYFSLWKYVLDARKLNLDAWGWRWSQLAFDGPREQRYLTALHDGILDAVMRVAGTLDLGFKAVDAPEAGQAVVPEEVQYGRLAVCGSGLVVPARLRDYELFLNLVEFFGLFLRQCSPRSAFRRWAFLLCRTLVEQSNRAPHVSGYFKMLAVCAQLADRYGYFRGLEIQRDDLGDPALRAEPLDWEDSEIEEIGLPPAAPRPPEDEEDAALPGHLTEVRSCYDLLQGFLHVCLQRLGEYKDDLLAACLRFILSLPLEFLNLRSLVGPLQSALQLGLSYLPLADTALTAVEHWGGAAPGVVAECLPPLLPTLQRYLAAEGPAGTEADPTTTAAASSSSPPTLGRPMGGRTTGPRQKRSAGSTDSSKGPLSDAEALAAIQTRVLRLLGGLGAAAREAAVAAPPAESRWGAGDDCVRLRLPFRDMAPDLALDTLLPQTATLALHSSDRRTKVAACELLHATVLYMVGRNASSPQMRSLGLDGDADAGHPAGGDAPSPFAPLYRRLFPVILQLAVDPEQVARQLFEPLIFQLIRWLTQNVQYESPETMALLDALLEGLAAPAAGARRDLAARGLEHFQRWALKRGRARSLQNVKSLYSRLYSAALHPNVWRRLGAGLACNRLVREFRESDELVSLHTLEMMRVALGSLALADADDPNAGTVAQWEEFLQRLERVLVHKSELLLRPDPSRGRLVGVKDAVEWLWASQVTRLEGQCREQSMRLFMTACSLLPGFDTADGPRRWLQARYQHNPAELVAAFELMAQPLPANLADVCDLSFLQYVQWTRQLETCLHVYTWLFAQRLLSPHQLFPARPADASPAKRPRTGKEQPASQLLRHVQYWLHHTMQATAAPLNVDSQVAFSPTPTRASADVRALPLTPLQRRKFQGCKVRVVERLMDFVTCLCRDFADTAYELSDATNHRGLLGPPLFRVLAWLALAPQRLGYDTNETAAEVHALAYAHRTLRALSALFGSAAHDWRLHRQQFASALSETLRDEQHDLTSADLLRRLYTSPAGSVTGALFLVRGYRLLHTLGLLLPHLPGSPAAEQLAGQLAARLFALPLQPEPVVVLISTELWSLCLGLGLPASVALAYITDTTPAGPPTESQPAVQDASGPPLAADAAAGRTKGRLFYATHRRELDDFLVRHSDRCVAPLVAMLQATTGPTAPEVAQHQHVADVLANVLDAAQARRRAKGLTPAAATADPVAKAAFDQFFAHADRLLAGPLPDAPPALALPAAAEAGRFLQRLVGAWPEAALAEGSPAAPAVVRAVARGLRTSASGPGTLLACSPPQLDVFLTSLSVVPPLLRHLPPALRGEVVAEVRRVVNDELPVQPRDLPPGSGAADHYLQVGSALLQAMAGAASPELLEAMVPFLRATDHPLQSTIARCLEQLFTGLDAPALQTVADRCMARFQDPDLPTDVRRAAVQPVLLGLLLHLPEAPMATFFARHVARLTELLGRRPSAEARDRAEAFLPPTLAFGIVEAMYRLLPAERIRRDVNQSFVSAGTVPTGRELNEAVLRKAHEARTWRPPASAVLDAALVLEYHQSALSCVAAALVATKQKEKLFTGLLFADGGRGDLFEHVVDLQKVHDFPVQTDYKYLRDALRRLRISGAAAPGAPKPADRPAQRLQYLSSQYLQGTSLGTAPRNAAGAFFVLGTAAASLSEDDVGPGAAIRQTSSASAASALDHPTEAMTPDADALDFGGTPDSPARDGRPSGIGGGAGGGGGGGGDAAGVTRDEGLEMDELNANPCMASYLRAIDHLESSFPATPVTGMPPWMGELLRKLGDESVHLNVRLFLAKVVLNRTATFRPFCGPFVVPLLRLAVAPNNGGQGFHYFLRDICLCLLEWNVTSLPGSEAEHLASALIERLMRDASSPQRFILANNLETIKLLLEMWGRRVRVNKRVILGWLDFDTSRREATVARATGLQLMGVVLANGYPAYDPLFDEPIVTEERLYQQLLQNLAYPRKGVQEAAAEVVGMALANLAAASTDRNDRTRLLLTKVCGELKLMYERLEYERFLGLLGKAGQHYEPVLDHFLPNPVVTMLPRLFGGQRLLALRIVLARATAVPDLYRALGSTPGDVLGHRDEEGQALVLRVIHRILPTMDPADITHFVEVMNRFLQSAEHFCSLFPESCRAQVYDCWIWLYDNRPDAFPRPRLVELLVCGLSDEALSIRTKLLEFWHHELRLPLEGAARLERLFGTLATRSLGERWLQYGAVLLLWLARHAPDYDNKRGIFPEGLAQCEYRELSVSTAWQFRSLPMTPMFSLQTATQPVGSLPVPPLSLTGAGFYETPPPMVDDAEGAGGAAQNLVLASQHYRFPITQRDRGSQGPESSLGSQTALLFVPFRRVPGSDGAPAPGDGTGAQASQGSQPVRRRFVKQPESVQTKFHILRATRLKREREALAVRQRLERQNAVRLYRTYRTGELPDIQISLRELLDPLSALCMRDIPVARAVLTGLFDAMFPRVAPAGPPSAFSSVTTAATELAGGQRRLEALVGHVARLLRASAAVPPVVAFLHDVCLSHERLTAAVEGQAVYVSAQRSGALRSGILLLEKAIQRASPQPSVYHSVATLPNSMRMAASLLSESPRATDSAALRPAAAPDAGALWLQLACLYKALGEDNVVRTILAEHLTVSPTTKQVLERVLAGQFADTLQLLDRGPPPAVESGVALAAGEAELWQHERLTCLRRLMKWADLAEGAFATAAELAPSAEPMSLFARAGEDGVPADAADHFHALWLRPELLRLWVRGRVRSQPEEVQALWDSAQASPARRRWLEAHCPVELAFLAAHRGHVAEALLQVRAGYRGLLGQRGAPADQDGGWLRSLQAMVELEEALMLLGGRAPNPHRGRGAEAVLSQYRRVCRGWQARRPGPSLPELEVWDELLFLRRHTAARLVAHVQRTVEEAGVPVEGYDGEAVQAQLFQQQSAAQLAAATVAREQGQLPLCQAYLRQCQEDRRRAVAGRSPFHMPFYVEIIRMQIAKAEERALTADGDKLLQYVERNGPEAEACDPALHWLVAGDAYAAVHRVMRAHPHFLPQGVPSHHDAARRALDAYRRACEAPPPPAGSPAARGPASPGAHPRTLEAALVRYSVFCDDLLQAGDTDAAAGTPASPADPPDAAALAEQSVAAVLQALAAGAGREARQRVPRVLELIAARRQPRRWGGVGMQIGLQMG